MSEIGENTKTFAKRKDSAVEVIKRHNFFTFFDRATTAPSGEISQTAQFEENGALQGSAKLIKGSRNLFDVSFEVIFPPRSGYTAPLQGEFGERLVLLAQNTKGEVFGSEGKLEPREGGQQITFRSWQHLSPDTFEIAADRKGVVLSAIRKGKPAPLPAIPRNHLEEINFVFT